MRFLIDAPLPPATARWLTSQGYDATHVEALDLLQAPDEVILRRAADEQRLLITTDLDFPEILAIRHLQTPGVILIRLSDATPEYVHERLATLLSTASPETLTNAVTVLEDLRFRTRKLPLT